jgi:hypothetical protein
MGAIVQSNSVALIVNTSVAQFSLMFGENVTQGNLIIAVLTAVGPTVTMVAETGESLALAVSDASSNQPGIYYGLAPASGGLMITVTLGGGNPNAEQQLHIYEVQGGYNTLDAKGTSNSSGTSMAVSTSQQTAHADEFVIAAFLATFLNETITPQAGAEASQLTESTIVGLNSMLSEGFEVTSQGTQSATATGTTANSYNAVIATFYNSNANSGGGGGGNSSSPTIAGSFLGSVTVVSSGPKNQSGPYLGEVSVVSSGRPKGANGPYLGEVVVGSAPSGKGGPKMGTVVILSSPPNGKGGPFLGTVTEV